MRNVGIIVLVGSLVLSGLMLLGWLAGLVAGIGGGLIHLLLVATILLAPAGVVAGALLIVLGKRRA
ncbi:MAG TPA: hypothetical protein VEX60_07885 [Pyrinomonadaceae bacterium]|nr:hypothetical protein [Pyrinomonadaceae bacterium]